MNNLTEAERDKIRRGIAAYSDDQKDLIAFLTDWKSQTEFDRHFTLGHASSRRVPYYTGDTFMLGFGAGFGHPQQKFLGLCQQMMRLGLIEAEQRDDGLVWYRATEAGRAEVKETAE